jgi:hypothetical protein
MGLEEMLKDGAAGVALLSSAWMLFERIAAWWKGPPRFPPPGAPPAGPPGESR